MRLVEGSRRRAVVVVAATVLFVGGTLTADAQVDGDLPPVDSGSSTTSTTAAPSSTTSTTSTTAPPPSSTTTTRPLLPEPGQEPTTSTTAPPTPGQPQASEPAPGGEGDGAPTDGAGPMPAELQAMVNSVARTRANNTHKLLAALEPLDQYGLDETNRAVVGFGRFPVAGKAVWSDDWWLPRFGPGWRLHLGLDIFAAYGTPVRAPVDGRVKITNGGLGGLAVYVVQPNRTYWYLAHLSGIAEGIAEGVAVRTGQVVGYVGDSGNAKGGRAHLHFEIHPNGGGPVPPKPVVDRFVSDALGLAPQLLAAYEEAYRPGQQAETMPVALPEPELDSLTPRAALLWASAANPAGGTLRLVEADALAAARRIDWDAVVADEARSRRAQRQVRLWLAPLVPPALARIAGFGA